VKLADVWVDALSVNVDGTTSITETFWLKSVPNEKKLLIVEPEAE
jgi:hypothetical protein